MEFGDVVQLPQAALIAVVCMVVVFLGLIFISFMVDVIAFAVNWKSK